MKSKLNFLGTILIFGFCVVNSVAEASEFHLFTQRSCHEKKNTDTVDTQHSASPLIEEAQGQIELNRYATMKLSDLIEQLKSSSNCSTRMIASNINVLEESKPLEKIDDLCVSDGAEKVAIAPAVSNPIKQEIASDLENLLKINQNWEMALKYAIHHSEDGEKRRPCCNKLIGWLSALNIGSSVFREGFQTYSLANPDMNKSVSGGILVGLSAVKFLSALLRNKLVKSQHQKIDDVINKFKPEGHSHDKASIAKLNALVPESLCQIQKITQKVASNLDPASLDIEDKGKLARLIQLKEHLTKKEKVKRCLLTIEGTACFAAQMVSSIAVLCSGQESPTSFWSTLTYAGLNNALDKYNSTCGNIPMDPDFIDAGEVFYLAAYLARKIPDSE